LTLTAANVLSVTENVKFLYYTIGMIKSTLILFFLFVQLYALPLRLHILGSGGPEVDRLASSSIVLAEGDDARLLLDCGSGAMLRFEQAGFQIPSLQAILISHLHIDHVVDLPSFMKAGYFSNRKAPLPILGPDKNSYFPSITTFIERQFGSQGTYAYMQDILSTHSDSFTLNAEIANTKRSYHFGAMRVEALNVHHGIVPALAYKITYRNQMVVYCGDTNDEDDTLSAFAHNADYLIINEAIASDASRVARALHITPEHSAELAQKSHAKHIILTHHMRRTLGNKEAIIKTISAKTDAPIYWAKDLSVYTLLDN